MIAADQNGHSSVEFEPVLVNVEAVDDGVEERVEIVEHLADFVRLRGAGERCETDDIQNAEMRIDKHRAGVVAPNLPEKKIVTQPNASG